MKTLSQFHIQKQRIQDKFLRNRDKATSLQMKGVWYHTPERINFDAKWDKKWSRIQAAFDKVWKMVSAEFN